ncbi:hypothetical protein DMN98_24955 [Vibrio parahaemolyticus]|nr:hypothetical protein [Vibrio parahaemolyticus]PLX58381.1 MAG: hypothetical protein C0632_18625 [Vibrio alginolyticus]
MKLVIDNLEFSIGGVRSLSKEKFSALYELRDMSDDLIQWAEEKLLSKSQFNLQIVNGSKIILIGEQCYFNKPNRFNRTAELKVNWVEQSQI